MMENLPDNASDSAPSNAPDSAGAQPLSAGAALREARKRLGMSVADVADHIKFAPRQIEALEQDDFAHLPEMAFVRGFVRSYARLVQLAPAPLLAALPEAALLSAPPAPAALAEVPFPNIYSARNPNIIWLAAALAVAIALAVFAWLHGNASNAPKAPHVETLELPVALPVSAVPDAEAIRTPQDAAPKAQQAEPIAKPAAEDSAAIQAAAIRLVFDEESWAEVKDKDGKILLSQINPGGSEQSINGTPPFSVVIGHANGAHLYYKGQTVDLAPHTRGQVARLTLE